MSGARDRPGSYTATVTVGPGCLIANTTGELLTGDEEVARSVRGILSGVEDGFLQGLRAAATMLTMLLEGLQVIVKSDSDHAGWSPPWTRPCSPSRPYAAEPSSRERAPNAVTRPNAAWRRSTR